jgi:glycosyltransferase involved in cell wall biosynthesis
MFETVVEGKKMAGERLSVLSLGNLPTSDSMGGTSRVALELCLALAQRGNRVTAVSPWTVGAELVESSGDLEIIRFGGPRTKRWIGSQLMMIGGAYRAARSALSRAAVSVVLAHDPGACVGTSLAFQALNKRVPLVFMFYASHADEIRTGAHQYERFRSGLAGRTIHPPMSRLLVQQRAWLEAATLRGAAKVVALSRYAKEWAQQLYGVEDSKFTVFPAGVDTRRFCPPQDDVSDIRRRLGLPEKRFILFTLRNLHPRMGVDVLVHAMPALVARCPEMLLIIGGGGMLLESLRRTVVELNLQDHVHLMGRLSETDLPAYYQAADMFVLPTQTMEGFGMVTLEALACGTPVLGTPIGATPEILTQLGPEFLSEGCDAQSLKSGILRMHSELLQRSDIRLQCRRLVEARYTWDATAARLEDLMYSAIGVTEGSSA